MSQRLPSSVAARTCAILLCAAVCVIHLKDQNWFAFDKDPRYVLAGYILLEVAAVAAIAWLLVRPSRTAWLLAAAVALGPLAGYVLSRGPGLPSYRDDIGNWSEALGVLSLLVEGSLLVLSTAVLLASREAVATGRRVLPAANHRRQSTLQATADR